VLRAIEAASQDSIKRAKQALDVGDSDSRRRLQGAQTAAAVARKELIETRSKALKDDRTLRAKYGGSTSQEAQELKKAQTALARARTEALNNKVAPPLPLDPKLVEIGKTYTAADGLKYDIIGLDAEGNPVGRPHMQAAYTAPSDAGQDDAELLNDDELEGDDLGD